MLFCNAIILRHGYRRHFVSSVRKYGAGGGGGLSTEIRNVFLKYVTVHSHSCVFRKI